MITEVTGTCQFGAYGLKCTDPATIIVDDPCHIATDETPIVGIYCAPHADVVLSKHRPRTIITCGNCGARKGID